MYINRLITRGIGIIPVPKVRCVVQTTSDYKKTGIYSAERDDTNKPITIDWGDGTVEEVDGNVSQKIHNYTSVGIFNVTVRNVKTYTPSYGNNNWPIITSRNFYTLKEVILPDSITSIQEFAFFYCGGIVSITIPNSVTSIGKMAFYYCSGLTSVTIPDSVTSIGGACFYQCSGLTTVSIGSGVTSIGNQAF